VSRIGFLLAGLVILGGCQSPPTKVREVQTREFNLLIDKTQRPIELHEGMVVLDARSAFDHGLNRVENSLHFPPENVRESSASGEPLKDPRQLALRLSLLGIQPLTPVVVLGYGLRGQGEEAQVAWALVYMGVQDVQVAGVDLFRKAWTQHPSAPAKNTDLWKANPRLDLKLSKSEFLPLMEDAKGRREKRIVILDVRSPAEFLGKGSLAVPDVGAINIEWKEFFTAHGRPDPAIKAKLKGVDILPTDRVIVIDDKGQRSAAVAYALLALGFERVQNVSVGWRGVLAR